MRCFSTEPSSRRAAHFAALPARCADADADVAELVEQLARRSTRFPQRQGRLPRAHASVDGDESAEDKILAHFGHPTEPPRPAPARSREPLDFA